MDQPAAAFVGGPFNVMRPEVQSLVALGPLPGEQGASAEQLAKHEAALRSIAAPVSDDEARALVPLFGNDGCFGLAWSLLHLVESSPNWPLADALNNNNEWVVRLRGRASARGEV